MRTRRSHMRLLGGPVPLGIPPVFLSDLLDPTFGAIRNEDALASLLAEYLDASGYAFDWGQMVVQNPLSSTVWHIVPVRFWEDVRAEHPRPPARIPELLPVLVPAVRTIIESQLPSGLELAGLQRHGRRSRYSLLALVLLDPAREERAHRWLERRFLPELLPALLTWAQVLLGEALCGIQSSLARGDCTSGRRPYVKRDCILLPRLGA